MLTVNIKNAEIIEFIWVKGKSLGSTACMGKIAASVLLMLFINGNEIWHTTDTH